MGTPHQPNEAVLVLGVLSSIPELLLTSAERASRQFGPIRLASDVLDFGFTSYYDEEMGTPIKRRFFTFSRPIAQEALADVKLATNEIEAEFARSGSYPVPRPVNLDPGYLTDSKLVLATTKDYSHRIYLRDGIYAEVTLVYRGGKFEPQPWTYPDYRSEAYNRFFCEARAAHRPN